MMSDSLYRSLIIFNYPTDIDVFSSVLARTLSELGLVSSSTSSFYMLR